MFVNENCCLCICFNELDPFYLLLVVALVILIAVPFVFSRSVNIACRNTQNTARIKRFWRLHIDKTISMLYLEIKNNHYKCLLCWSLNLVMFIQIRPQLALQKWEPAGHIECFHMTSWWPYWCPRTMKRRPCWCSKPVLWELNSFLMQTCSFVPINLHKCWPREWKHSIECFHMTSRPPYWCPKTMKQRPCWCPKLILWELNSFLM